jgi:hypothetical protein
MDVTKLVLAFRASANENKHAGTLHLNSSPAQNETPSFFHGIPADTWQDTFDCKMGPSYIYEIQQNKFSVVKCHLVTYTVHNELIETHLH